METALQSKRLRRFGHLERMDPTNNTKSIMNIDINGTKHRGRSSKQWIEVIREDLNQLILSKEMAPQLPKLKKDNKLENVCIVLACMKNKC